MLTLITPAIT